jgi:hypothetical protein
MVPNGQLSYFITRQTIYFLNFILFSWKMTLTAYFFQYPLSGSGFWPEWPRCGFTVGIFAVSIRENSTISLITFSHRLSCALAATIQAAFFNNFNQRTFYSFLSHPERKKWAICSWAQFYFFKLAVAAPKTVFSD